MPSAFRSAVESKSLEAILDGLAPDVVFRSPVVYKPYVGREAVGMILAAVMQVFEDFRYAAEIRGEDGEVLLFEAHVGDRQIQGVDILRLDAAGLVTELTVMVRPMSGMRALAEAMRARLEGASA